MSKLQETQDREQVWLDGWGERLAEDGELTGYERRIKHQKPKPRWQPPKARQKAARKRQRKDG